MAAEPLLLHDTCMQMRGYVLLYRVCHMLTVGPSMTVSTSHLPLFLPLSLPPPLRPASCPALPLPSPPGVNHATLYLLSLALTGPGDCHGRVRSVDPPTEDAGGGQRGPARRSRRCKREVLESGAKAGAGASPLLVLVLLLLLLLWRRSCFLYCVSIICNIERRAGVAVAVSASVCVCARVCARVPTNMRTCINMCECT